MSKKNITLVTWSGTGNFGTSLQAYALERKLENLGYRVTLVSDVNINQGWRSCARGIRNILRGLLPKKSCHGRIELWKRSHLNEIKIDNVIRLAWLRLWTSVYVTGSDQIWNTYVEFSPGRFLAFAGKGCRVAYASSIGTDTVNPMYAESVRKLLMKFDAIGVREEAAVRALSDLTGRKDIVRVVDPTFILGRNEWLNLAKEAKFIRPIPTKYVFCYLIGKNPEYISQLRSVVEKIGVKDVVFVPSLESPNVFCDGVNVYDNATPSEFVYLIANAQLVCTDSFHATAMSLIFERQFVEFVRFSRDDSRSQNSRLDELLGRYNLLDRYYESWCKRPCVSINYAEVTKSISDDCQRSEMFLHNALEKKG